MLLLAVPASAGAHAVLLTSSPGWEAVLGAAPRVVTLRYDEDVVPAYARVAVESPGGRDLAGPPRVTGSVVVVPVEAGRAGSYTVRWKMVASDDGHVTEGAFSFGVRAKPLPPAPQSGVGVPVAPQVLTWLQFLGVVLAGGALTFRAIVLAPAARALGDRSNREAATALWVAVVGAAVALHAGLFGFLIGAYPIVGGGIVNVVNTQIIPIRVGTHLGQAFTLTTFAWLGVLALLVGAWATPRRREPLLACAGVASLGIAFGISWASHSASRGTFALIADYVHVVAGALWAGGLVALLNLLGVARPVSRPDREALVLGCLLRFSKLAVIMVGALVLAGAYLSVRELPGPSALITSTFGVTLLLKTAVFAGALALGGLHRRVAVPRIAAGAPAATIRRTLAVEATLLLAALFLAAILSQTPPPH
ncbi:MAG: copper resistance protein CopC/CopD [Solirubrobacterales bacterium]|nr:copper resistance protein CopC/CopD [Solirubrobacterales bacterium]